MGDEVLAVENFDDSELGTMIFITRKGICLNAEKDDIPCQGRATGGVRGILLNDGDSVVFATQMNGAGEAIVASDAGAIKRVIVSLFQPIARGRKGMMIIDGKSEVAFADYVIVPYKLAIVRADNSVEEMDTEDISIEPRPSKGKPLARNTEVVKIIALKYRSEYADGNVQIKF